MFGYFVVHTLKLLYISSDLIIVNYSNVL